MVTLILASCQAKEAEDHAHDAHGAHLVEGAEIPSVDATVWTDKTELFVEYPALVVGATSRFAAHFTIMERHRPVREGSLTVSLIKGENGIRNTVDSPDSPGIFKPSLQPKEAGLYQLVFELKTSTITDKIVIEGVTVYASMEDAASDLSMAEGDDGSITFLKEQAWKIDFQTAKVVEKEIYQTIPTSGRWKVSPSDYQTLIAPNSGKVNFNSGNLNEGMKVQKGQVLMSVSSAGLTSNNLSAEIQKAKAAYDQASLEYGRKKQLFESRIVPKSEFEQVEQKYLVAKSTYETLNAGYTSDGKQILTPFEGYVKSIAVDNGSFVSEGASLVTITSHKTSLLEVQVSPSYAVQLQDIHDIHYQNRSDHWSGLKATAGKVLSVGKEVESDQPLLSVFAEINDVVEMPEGSFTEVQIAFGQPKKTAVVPESALLEDYGIYSVIVELSGESFDRRPVSIGRRNGQEVEILEGVQVGEVVVTRGAYQVKMASMSGQAPAHGHEH
ncbi:efflux RND transporter periplasmic adaptor subunit [Algoriphagus sp. AGSA1]|uniref:efflux RND transporter periplasmic adaptor subunit n=1 Tax=unclassified Algoriphagus TaxID=2641541 RepID=UPI001CE1FB8D|nr:MULTISPECIES: efflux RND transporter periplasmic adaptor subunit [unclassified Algoriphagus]MCE7056237.1 efflux RND transporter periplasmic adaptor subunit [Algoriphagus sp. AGSA1]